MILLGIVLLVLGLVFWRPLMWVAGVLIVVGVVLWLSHVGAYGTWPYVQSS